MKKLITICFLTFFLATGNAQVKNKKYLNELDQYQLNLELTQSLNKIRGGKTWTGIGTAIIIIGAVLLIDDANGRHNSTEILGGLPTYETAGGIFVLAGGIVTTGLAITTWTLGSNRKRAIELELVKYSPAGNALLNGIGLKIRF
jgi:hypothetical protein